MDKVDEELKKGLELLKKEWQEDLAQYKAKFLNTSIADRKTAGITWHPIQLRKSRIGMGERLIIEIERMDSKQGSSFGSGKSVSFFTTNERFQSGENRVKGVVNQVRQDSMTVTIQEDEVPDWMEHSRLGVDLLFDEASYREMEYSLKTLIKGNRSRNKELKNILLGDDSASVFSRAKLLPSQLNESQKQACSLIQDAQDVAIVHGPPGTGKTSTLIQAILESVSAGKSVLVCAPSNAAVDLMVEGLVDIGIETTRFGHPARVEEKILNQTIDAKIALHSSFADLKKLRKDTDQYLRLAKQYKRSFGPKERAQRKLMFGEVTKLREAAKSLEEYIHYDVFQRTKVFATTLVGASSNQLRGLEFDEVFIDEAAQGLEAATWIPIQKAKKVIFAGDHCQLPPTIKSYEAAKEGLSKTLFEKVISRKPQAAKMLEVQYRMPDAIMGFSNQHFYDGKLRSAEDTASHILENQSPLSWIDTAGAGFNEQKEVESLSTFNPREGKFLCKYLNDVLVEIGIGRIKENRWSIGLIAPYSAQVRYLKSLIFDSFEFPNLRAFPDLITIDTVDGFQGQERDFIFISLVRSNEQGEIGFLSEERRMNVALTRAKRKLVLVGDSATLASNEFYSSLLEYVESNGEYKSIWEMEVFD